MTAFGLLAGVAQAQTVLTASSYLPANNVITEDILMAWAQDVEHVTEGRVKVELLAKPVTAPAGTFDAVRDGLADVSWTVDGLTPGRFTLSRMAELPGLGNSAEATTIAYQRTYDKFFAQADEHAGVKLLGVFTHGPGNIFNSMHPIETVADAEGLKIRAAGGVMTDVVAALGATPIVKPASEVFELLNAGIIDGVMFPAGSIAGFNLQETIKFGTLVPGGLYNAAFSMFMNEAAFETLSPQDQEAVMSVSGEVLAKRAGIALDEDDRVGLAAIQANPEISITTASQGFIDEMREKTASVEQQWIDQAAAKGVDGAAALEYFREQIKELSASN
ncbi:TRAP transporter substrate-binding protein [Aquibium sp. LZ166]|uniref:TRAP transporter substrate-binding protein n=1 Tax=Aquibium pacificus TaxID=3153579 RepID=A0ABV3SKH9_9HYPH